MDSGANQELMPAVLERINLDFQAGIHAILHGNTDDRIVLGSETDSRALDLVFGIADHFSRNGYKTALYTPSQGIKELCPAEGASKAIPNANGVNDHFGMMNVITRLLRDANDRWLVIVLHPEALAPRSHDGSPAQGHHLAEFFHWLGKDPIIANGASRLLMVCYTTLPSKLITNCPGYDLIEVPLPLKRERKVFIEKIRGVAKRLCNKAVRLAQGLTNERIADLTSGMTLIGIEKFIKNSALQELEINPQSISQAKSRDICDQSQGTLEICNPEYGLDQVGGLKSLKLYFSKILARFQRGARDVPLGMLLAGSPGSGKSYVAKALAKELGWTFVQLARIRDSLYGQSEERLSRALSVVRQMGHVVLFIDEIDQSLGQRNSGPAGDSGTSARMWAFFMQWMSEQALRGKVLIVAATNRPDLLDAALVDRFDVVIPFIRPGKAELIEIAAILLKRNGRRLGEIKAVSIAEALQDLNLTGRNLETVLVNAGHLADDEASKENQPIRLKHLRQAAQDYIPRQSNAVMEIIELTSLDMCDRKSLLPWNGPEGRLPGVDIPRHLQMFVTKDGGLDKVELVKALNQLRESHYAGRRAA